MTRLFEKLEEVIVVKDFIVDNKPSQKGVSGKIISFVERMSIENQKTEYSYGVKLENNDFCILKETDIISKKNISEEQIKEMIKERDSLNIAKKHFYFLENSKIINDLIDKLKDIKKDIDKYYIFDKQADYYFDLLEIQNLINENFK